MRKGVKAIFVVALVFVFLGIILTTAGVASGGSIKVVKEINFGSTDYVDVDETYTEEIESLNLELAAGTLTVKEGDSFRIEAKNIPERYYEFYVEDKTLHVDKKDHDWFFFDWFDWDSYDDTSITVYVPKGFEAKEMDLEVSAGTVTIDSIVAKNAEIKMNAGKVSGSNVTISDSGKVKVNAGTLELEDVNFHDTKIQQNAGAATLSGSFTGETKAECNAGSMTIKANGTEKEYNFQIESSAGSITLNGERYSNTKSEIDNNANNEFDVECNAGSITISTK